MAVSELILGGQKSGKSRRAELLARRWLDESPAHRAVLIATGQAHDAEMAARIARHQQERAERVPGLLTLEEPRDLAGQLARVSSPQALVVVDCLTLWLTNWLMPVAAAKKNESNTPQTLDWQAQEAHFLDVLQHSPGPVVLVGNEIGLGVIPLGREVRAFVDALGVLNQQLAQACDRVTLMV
ncbi:MAG: bifunctional adenosylcobinamide kinase/adenosylcobinamide-phosphate guanylyltransferase, partial [Proteobacteria bacterium]|nr:bifunctional adenosylcobinamide kinase/adenosylcobinamide-phosphate guanylyltransferase [Pseudomonadota bacterium]